MLTNNIELVLSIEFSVELYRIKKQLIKLVLMERNIIIIQFLL
jgi:hypothetical protein